jgi:lactoylglutathione lyase
LEFKVQTYGIILETERFDDCVAFYREVLGLPVWFEKAQLVCFRFGDGYLMVETGGVATKKRKSKSQNPTTLRFNVESVEGSADALMRMGVHVGIETFDWGTVGTFVDPDGNTCQLKNADDSDYR